MVKYELYTTIREGNKFFDMFMFLIIIASLFLTFNTQVSAMIQDYLDFTPTATFVYPEFTNENQASIEVVDKDNVDKIFFDGVESRDKVNVQLQEGENKFTLILSGRGKESEHLIVITKDTTPPVFDTTFDFDKERSSESTISINGVVSEPSKVYLNGVECLQVVNVTCELEITGRQDFVFKVVDRAGNEFRKDFSIVLDNTPPEISINYEPNTIQDKAVIKVTSDEALSGVKINDVVANGDNQESFHLQVNLNIGNNPFNIIATDTAGNKVEKQISIERKSPPPVTIPSNTGNNGGNNNPHNNSGGGDSGSNCSSISIRLFNVKTPVFVGESQTGTVQLNCADGAGYANQTINLTVTYSNGNTKNYSSTTNSSGIATFTFTVENISGSTSMIAKYGFAQTSVNFLVN